MNNDNPNTRLTDVPDFFASLRAGVFERKVATALSDVAGGVISTGKQGSVTITLTMKQIAESTTVHCAHKVAFSMPTQNGKQSQEDLTDTPLHVGKGGKLSLFPENQHQMFDATGAVTSKEQ